MDDKNQPMNQLNNLPKDDETNVSSSAPVEMEPSTQGVPIVSTPTQPTPVSPTPAPTVEQPQPTPMQQPAVPEPALPAGPTPQLLEAPKKKNGMLIVAIVVVLVVVLAVVGMVVYNALY